ncbi:MAG: hypothetical protein QOE33_1296 [Acidobacteriota bacterium]|nr:hypothetical protein [Acidobacteriota bacterium]
MDVREIKQLFDYNEWANAQVLDAAARLSEEEFTRNLGNSFSSVRDTLAHVLFAEWVWLRRWMGESPRGWKGQSPFADVASLRAEFSVIEGQRAELLAGLADDALARVVAYTNTKGEEWRYTLGSMMRHVVNHSTYHRGQVTTMLRQLGAHAPSTDLLLYEDVTSNGATRGSA